MAKFKMCTADCNRAKECKRHKESGTIPEIGYQSYSCLGYKIKNHTMEKIQNYDGNSCESFLELS